MIKEIINKVKKNRGYITLSALCIGVILVVIATRAEILNHDQAVIGAALIAGVIIEGKKFVSYMIIGIGSLFFAVNAGRFAWGHITFPLSGIIILIVGILAAAVIIKMILDKKLWENNITP